ncbi:MAG: ABC transporter permease [Sphaerochaetaceae bacterium]|nr:ABC transporter permease [Sphaerochaetaceae bacterium]MDC7237963.1 ABC transporter permease [Sphaerochaetaceae bacterium]
MVENTTWRNKFWNVFINELTKIFKSKRFFIITFSFILIALFSLYYLSFSANNTFGRPKLLLLQVFTTQLYFIPSFTILLAVILPLCSIAFGFDTFSSDFMNKKNKDLYYNNSQKEILLFSKALAIMITFSILLFILFFFLVTSSSIIYKIDIRAMELMRILAFYLLSILYSTLWYIISMFLSLKTAKSKQSLFFSILVYFIIVVLWAPLILLISFGITNSRLIAENMYSLFSNISPFILYKNAAQGILLQPMPAFAPKLFNPLFAAFLIPGGLEYQSFSLIWLNILEFMAMIIFILSLGYIKIQKNLN